MHFRSFIPYIIGILCCMTWWSTVSACSMYKITRGDKTMVGNNEDAWRISPHIWFEASTDSTLGVCFTGSRSIGNDNYAAQSGMNEHGLTYSRLTSYHPINPDHDPGALEKILHKDRFLMEVLRVCSNIEEVRAYYERFDHSCFIQDVFVYVESSGKYLVVEPYHLICGTDPEYVQANFCPSITPEKDRRFQQRYARGRDFIGEGADTSLAFCTAASNQMHVCREKIGDGTLLTTIWDTRDKQVHLYHYHDYDHRTTFSLSEELSKPDHQIAVRGLFPQNPEFESLANYITPYNTPALRMGLALLGGFFFLSAIFFGITSIKKREIGRIRILRILLSAILVLAFCYMYVLTTNIGIYYFPSPYVHPSSLLITLSSAIPYLIVLAFIGIGYFFLKNTDRRSWGSFSLFLLMANCLAFSALSVGFVYWRILF